MKKTFVMLFSLLIVAGAFAQGNVTGKWKTIDDDTGEMKSIVEIKIVDGKLTGTILELAPGEDPEKLCDKCTDHRKDQKIVGMQIISGLVKDDGKWEGDDGILDPAKGSIYDCEIWEEDGKLQVRGYLGWFFRTQTWVRP